MFKMKYAILGGTFNPIHYGHLFLVEEVRGSLGYDHIIFIPSYLPAHKAIAYSIDPQHRYNMLKIAIRPFPYFFIDDCELKRGGISYTIETITEIKRKYGDKDIFGLVIGDDLVNKFHLWKNAEELANNTELIVAKRIFSTQVPFNYPHKYLDNKILPISASEIRERIAANKSVQFLLPDKVYDYIKKHKLYR
jgi:nicotinate-nucleotide adenylyltransferase